MAGEGPAKADSWRHSLLECHMAKCVWALEKDELVEHLCVMQDPDPRGWLASVFECLSHADAVRVGVTLWEIWFARRKVIHENSFQSPLLTHGFITRYCVELQESLQLQRPKETRHLAQPWLRRWIPPGAGQTKVNVDAALSKNERRAAVAAIARSQEGVFLGASGLVIEGIVDPEIAKALACREGMDLASDLVLSSFKLALDCENVIKNLKGTGMEVYGQILRELKARSMDFEAVDFVHESRSSNVEAHVIARSLILTETGRFVWFLSPPDGICNRVNQAL